MQLQRTANAGVLLEVDGVTILLDGVCQRIDPYLETPEAIRKALLVYPPDVIAFTHDHADHFCKDYAQTFYKQTLRPVLGPECLLCRGVISGEYRVGQVCIRPVASRHIGKTEIKHRSYVITGRECVWFMGDASPLQWKHTNITPKPDVLIAPYAYATTSTGWAVVKELKPRTLVLLHLPPENADPCELWKKVRAITRGENWLRLEIPSVGQWLQL